MRFWKQTGEDLCEQWIYLASERVLFNQNTLKPYVTASKLGVVSSTMSLLNQYFLKDLSTLKCLWVKPKICVGNGLIVLQKYQYWAFWLCAKYCMNFYYAVNWNWNLNYADDTAVLSHTACCGGHCEGLCTDVKTKLYIGNQS